MLTFLLALVGTTSGYLEKNSNQVSLGLISGLKFPQDSASCVSADSSILQNLGPCISLNISDLSSILSCLELIPISLYPLPAELIKCQQHLKTDSIRLNNTFPIFRSPLFYNLTVSESVTLKNVDITKDLIDIQTFLSDNQEFNAAAAVGQVARRMFLRESKEKDIEEFFKGFVTGIGLMDDAYNCLQNPEIVLKQLEAAFKLLDRKNLKKFVSGLKGIYTAFTKVTKQLKACDQGYASEVKRIEEALKILRYPYYYKIVIAKDILLNGISIERDLRNVVRAFEEQYYYDLGYDIGFFISKFKPAK